MFYTARCEFSFLCSGLLTVCDTLRLHGFLYFCRRFSVYHQVLFLVGRADRIELHIVWRRQERLIQLLHIVYHGCNMVHHAVCTSCLFQSHQTSFLALAYVWYGCATFWFRYAMSLLCFQSDFLVWDWLRTRIPGESKGIHPHSISVRQYIHTCFDRYCMFICKL